MDHTTDTNESAGNVDAMTRVCHACGADPGEDCAPLCIGAAQHQEDSNQNRIHRTRD